jgi:DNA-binding winged helix-turn-helix (wHTH) protein
MRLRFGDCVFDSDTREIFRGGKPVHVSPKAFALLEALIARRPKATSKDELHSLLWPDTFVSDANLPNLVAELREALGDDAQEPRSIRTVPRFGYAFRAEAAIESAGPAPLAFRLIWGDREIALRPGENLIGREEGSALWIDDALVSRHHARIVIDESGAVLEDLGSKNGTLLRGRRIETPTKLADEDLITIGPASMIFRVLHQTGSTASATEEQRERPRPGTSPQANPSRR